MEEELKLIRICLQEISDAIHKVVNEGITIYTHQDGPEELN